MMLEGTNASSAIRWVRQDLDEALQEVRDNLEAFAADTEEREPLKIVQDRLEQLNLTFLTMEQHGASILTDEMIAVGGHMLHSKNSSFAESLAAMTDAVIVLPSYLDRLQAGHDDLPILLLPTLNELRATYDETLMSEGTLFAPQLDLMIPELSGNEADAVGDSEFNAFARRVRNQYQAALVGWLKEQSKTELLLPLREVCQNLSSKLGRHSLRRLWWIADMTIAGFQDAAIDNDLPLRRMFARLDMTLKAMTEGGEDGPSEDAITALSRALLFHAATGRPGSKPIATLRKRFKLEELIPDREALLRAKGAVTGRDAELFKSIGDAVREEMSLVKDALDMELRTGRIESEQRQSSRASLQQLADTLNMLNLPVAAKAVDELIPSLEETAGAVNDSLDSPLMKLAQKLIEVESVLETHIRLLGEPVDADEGSRFIDLPAHEFRLVISAMLDQCVSSLHDLQDAVRKRLGGDKQADFDEPLACVVGALQLAGQGEVAALTEKLGRNLHAGLHIMAEKNNASDANLDSLTDAVAALELYLAGCRDQQTNSLQFLEIMHERLDGLPESSSSGEQVEKTSISLPERPVEEKPAKPTVKDKKDRDGIDPAMQQVFLEEFDTVIRQLDEAIPAWLEDPDNAQALTDVRRGFHTIKGSGRMVGAMEAGDFAWRIEELLNRVTEDKMEPDETVIQTVTLAATVLPEIRARLVEQPSVLSTTAIAGFSEFARQLAMGENPPLDNLLAILPDGYPEDAAEPTAAADDQPVESTTDPDQQLDTTEKELADLMITEIGQYVGQLEAFVNGTDDVIAGQVSDDLVRAVHTLAGTLAMSPLGSEADLARQLEDYLLVLQKNERDAPASARPTLNMCIHRFHQRLSILEDGNATTYPLDDQQLMEELAALINLAAEDKDKSEKARSAAEEQAETTTSSTATSDASATVEEADESQPKDGLEAVDAGILAIFLEEAVEVLERCDTLLNTWRDKLSDLKLVQNLQREIHTFKGGARMAGLETLGDLSHAMESLLERIAANRLQATVAAVQALEEGTDKLTIWVEELQANRMPEPGDALARFKKRAKALSLPGEPDDLVAEPDSVEAPLSEAARKGKSEAETEAGREVELEAKDTAKAKPEAAAKSTEKPGKADQEDASPVTAGAEVEESAEKTLPTRAKDKKDQPQASDATDKQAAATAKSKPSTPPASQIPAAKPAAGKEDGRKAATAAGQIAVPQRKREFREVPDRPAVEAGEDTGGQQQIRVAAELIDSLVNYAGEISIYRARLEQQLGAVRFNLKEVESTVGRLQEQLRKMEIEAEAQMATRYQHASTKGGSADFDPLELDRFSNMQQLSRALTESVNDLLNLQEMQTEAIRQAESLLVQQSRVSTDLQEGLMQTRMTPFGSAAPRLRRVVRAAAAETGKRARLLLQMAGSSDQLDRNVLERITAPLEHMLRNSVVHGIEDPKQRAQLGKPEEGEIIVTVEGEATEFVVRVEDDGGGVNLEAVRKRAIERGMLKKDEEIDDRRLTGFIMESGFSTSQTVTGLAGRGVGMDVVNSEIKQIGGSMDIESEAGKGTCFTIRIPFSLSVMQAIGVTVSDRHYLVPLNSVSGVSKMMPADYVALRDSDNPVFEFAGEEYPVMELEPLLGEQPIPVKSENVNLLMIRSGESKAAFRVAELQGHQEIVMKPVGPQVSSIPGILGATISGDGQVVIILDMGPVIRRGLAIAADPSQVVVPPTEKKQKRPLIMVVDDSITMRKVTSRVLENHSLDVVTAQDGLDAIENLHECVPDLMLLDIEMPRMDGYELAEHVRGDPRLRHVPIVMITSRAGQKHRKRAREAGANDYMTKPYQEADLVTKVSEMLKVELQPRRAD